MRLCSFELDFKKEITNIEKKGLEAIVKNIKYGNGDLVGEINGFAYTSSSSYAMLSVNGLTFIVSDYIDNSVKRDELGVSHFAITKNNVLIMVCEDEDENYYYFVIEPSEFY